VVPDRAVHGYGLTPPIVELVRARRADVLVTVDNGMASHEAVALARSLGMQVLITDHHLPVILDDGTVSLPDADVNVNPNQPDCAFPSKALVGVGEMFYVLLALRAELRQRGPFDASNQPCIDGLPDLVMQRAVKVSLHELGHAIGLPHRNDGPECLMNDAGGAVASIDRARGTLCEPERRIAEAFLHRSLPKPD